MANLPLETCATLACLWEATAPKPGNVHRGADFEDLTFADFVASAAVIGPAVAEAAEVSVGQAVLNGVRATQRAVATNTNLGTLLLLTPLAAVPRDVAVGDGIEHVLDELDARDTACVYKAIREAQAGGLGRVEEADVMVDQPPSQSLVDVMRLAAVRDLVAAQYVNGFAHVLADVAPWIEHGHRQGWSLADTIVHAHLRQMASVPDSLIARKCGADIARQAADRAAHVLEYARGSGAYSERLRDLDFWLRSDGHRRNPGSTADLIAAALFVLLRDGRLDWPVRFFDPINRRTDP